MGAIILGAAFLIEAGFATYCILTKTNQRETRSLIRIGALGVFVILTLTAVIQWSFRWYGLAALLAVWAAIGAWTLIRTRPANEKEEKEKVYKPRSIVLHAAGAVLLVAVALIPALLFPEHELIETTGAYDVATALYTYRDESRVEPYTDTGEFRKLTVGFWYPENYDAADVHTFPLVVFSHGGLGIKSSNESLYHELASHGYVVCSIDHTYQALFTTDVDGNTTWIDRGYLQEVNTHDAHARKQQAFEYFQKWMAIRTGDIDFVIDTILAQAANETADPVYQLVDVTKIGVMGHSLGGSAALGVGRMRDDVSAVIALESPFLDDIEGVQDGEFVFTDEVYPLPVLNVYSDASWSHLAEWPQYVENYELLSDTEATAFNVHVSGVGHLTLTDLALTSPILTRILDGQPSPAGAHHSLKTINKVVLEFFDAYLKGMGNFTAAGTY